MIIRETNQWDRLQLTVFRFVLVFGREWGDQSFGHGIPPSGMRFRTRGRAIRSCRNTARSYSGLCAASLPTVCARRCPPRCRTSEESPPTAQSAAIPWISSTSICGQCSSPCTRYRWVFQSVTPPAAFSSWAPHPPDAAPPAIPGYALAPWSTRFFASIES